MLHTIIAAAALFFKHERPALQLPRADRMQPSAFAWVWRPRQVVPPNTLPLKNAQMHAELKMRLTKAFEERWGIGNKAAGDRQKTGEVL